MGGQQAQLVHMLILEAVRCHNNQALDAGVPGVLLHTTCWQCDRRNCAALYSLA